MIRFGSYQYKDTSTVSSARQLFLNAVREGAPIALVVLEGEPYREYQRFAAQAVDLPLYNLTHESATTAEAFLDEGIS
jgi:hypothetical protein